MSSNPATETSSGTRIPRSPSVSRAPMAMRALAARMAVGRAFSISRAQARAPPSMEKTPGSTSFGSNGMSRVSNDALQPAKRRSNPWSSTWPPRQRIVQRRLETGQTPLAHLELFGAIQIRDLPMPQFHQMFDHGPGGACVVEHDPRGRIARLRGGHHDSSERFEPTEDLAHCRQVFGTDH